MSSWRLRARTCAVGLGAMAVLGGLACGGSNEPSVEVPALTLLGPSSLAVGSGPFTLTVIGEHFVATSVVRWNGNDRMTTFVDSTRLTARILAADIETPGTAQVTVFTPGAGSSDPLTFGIGQSGGPQMTVTSVAPAFGTAGGPDQTITVTGTGFVAGTQVLLDWTTSLATTVVSGTSLSAVVPASVLARNQTHEVRAVVPGVTASPQAVSWEVRAPVPTATSVSPAQATAGDGSVLVQVAGSGFVVSSVVMIGADSLPTRYVSGTNLVATVPESLLASPGTVALRVATPAPGGGASAAVNLNVVALPPVLTRLPLLGVTAARPGFNLEVHGEHFATTSVIEWNGTALPTTYRSGRRLIATVPGSRVAAAGTAQITVRTPGAGVSDAQMLTIHPVPSATLTDLRTMDLPARDLVWDGARGRLYASTPSSAGANGNSIVAIDPIAGSIAATSFVGSEPGDLDMSRDGQMLYVALDGSKTARRVTLPDLTPGLEFSLGNSTTVEELHVMPTNARTVAVSRRVAGSSPSNAGLYVFDDGVARSQTGPGHTGSNTFGWSEDGTAIYGYNFESTEFGVRRLDVTASGVKEAWVKGGLIDGFGVRVQMVGDLLYSSTGVVVDGELRERLGTCNMGGAFAVDRALGRAFFWNGATIRVCDIQSFQSLGEISVPSADYPAGPATVVRWGTDGLALTDRAKVYLVRTPLAAP